MSTENKETGQSQNGTSSNTEKEANEDQPLPVHNPLNPADKRQIAEEDIENEQKYKEAMTERD
jgi:hypothetical protein